MKTVKRLPRKWLRSAVVRFGYPCLYVLCLTGLLLLGTSYGQVAAHVQKQDYVVYAQSKDSKKTAQRYVLLEHAEKHWDICISLPLLRDSFWLAVNYGISDEAKHLGVRMHLYHAGGYDNLEKQIQQIRECVSRGADGVIISAISRDGLNPLIKELSDKGIPVVDLINGISSPIVKAHSKVSHYNMGYAIGRYIARSHPKGTPDTHIAWFPGLRNSTCVKESAQGFSEALKESTAKIIVTRYGETQSLLKTGFIRSVFFPPHKADLIVGTAATAEAATHVARKQKNESSTEIFATYFTPEVYRGIKRGNIKAAPTASPVVQSRIAMDQMVRILENKPYIDQVSPIVRVVDKMNIDTINRSSSLAPSGFRPTFVVNQVKK